MTSGQYTRPPTDENAILSPTKSLHASIDLANIRSPLGKLTTNSRAPHRPTQNHPSKPVGALRPLKRDADAILGNDRGLQYLKRRKASPARHRHHKPSNALNRLQHHQHVHSNESHAIPSDGNGHERPPRTSHQQHKQDHRTNVAESDSSSSEDHSGRESQSSFTSLINYDPSSQLIPQGPFLRCNYNNSKEQIPTAVSHAEVLRLRLQVAMYKIKTNQIHTPFDQLRIVRPTIKGSSPSETSAKLDHSRHALGRAKHVISSSASPDLPTGSGTRTMQRDQEHDTSSTPRASAQSRSGRHDGRFRIPEAKSQGVGPSATRPSSHLQGLPRTPRYQQGYHGRKSSETTIIADKQHSSAFWSRATGL